LFAVHDIVPFSKAFKGIVHTKNENSVVIYSLLLFPTCMTSNFGIQNTFCRMSFFVSFKYNQTRWKFMWDPSREVRRQFRISLKNYFNKNMHRWLSNLICTELSDLLLNIHFEYFIRLQQIKTKILSCSSQTCSAFLSLTAGLLSLTKTLFKCLSH